MIEEFVRAAMMDWAEKKEELCEAAIQTGLFGVMIINRELGFIGQVNPNVPYGQIHEYPDCDLAWERWVGPKSATK